MKINLSEIPAEGRRFEFDRKSGELNGALSDLIQDRPYQTQFTIRPLGNAFELRGQVETRISEVCSRCGWDLEMPITQSFNEILLQEESDGRKAHSVHGNQSVDFLAEGPDVTYYQGELFDAGEFIHEAIALSEPLYPSCGLSDCEHLKDVQKKQDELAAEWQRAERETTSAHPAFSVLESLKVNKTDKKQ